MKENLTSDSRIRNSSSHILIYLGGEGFIQGFILDLTTDELQALSRVPLEGRSPGWFAFDKTTSSIFVADERGSHLSVFTLDRRTGSLNPKHDFEFLPRTVHISLGRRKDRTAAGPPDAYLDIYAASYELGKFARYELTSNGTLKEKRTFNFSSGAHTHSSAVDGKQGLVFVANKDEDRIVIYRSEPELMKIGEINTFDPRLLMFDSVTSLLYSVSEADEGESEVKIFAVRNEDCEVRELGCFKMSLRGSGLATDHVHGHVAASVREHGKEGVWLLPITKDGRFDINRKRVFIPVAGEEARSLDLANSGRHIVVTCNSASNENDLYIYKVDYESAAKSDQRTGAIFKKASLIHAVNAGSSRFQSQLVIDVSEN